MEERERGVGVEEKVRSDRDHHNKQRKTIKYTHTHNLSGKNSWSCWPLSFERER